MVVSTLVLGLPNCCGCGNEEARADPQIQVYFYSIRHTFDCGLFMIAFANALALGENPQEVFLTRGTRGYTSGKVH